MYYQLYNIMMWYWCLLPYNETKQIDNPLQPTSRHFEPNSGAAQDCCLLPQRPEITGVNVCVPIPLQGETCQTAKIQAQDVKNDPNPVPCRSGSLEFNDNWQKSRFFKPSTGKNDPEPRPNLGRRNEEGRNPGRNSTSNIFRVFIKFCSKPKFRRMMADKFSQLASVHQLSISFEYFARRVGEVAPSTSNYINFKQFRKAWSGSDEFSRAYRCLFHCFVSSVAANHCLTLRGKHRMVRESVLSFLGSLHHIEQELGSPEAARSDQASEEGSRNSAHNQPQ